MAVHDANPYSPPSTASGDDRGNCPVCGERVGYFRFLLPLGHCSCCGNYLAVRNWGKPSWPWILAIVAIVLAPVVGRLVWGSVVSDFAYTKLPILLALALILLRIVYDKLLGRLVPAICWGFFALPDDDRIRSNPRSRPPL